MSAKIELSAKVEAGKVKWKLAGLAKNTFAQFEGKAITITVELEKRKRSYLQNNYWWGVVIEIVYATFREFGERVSKADCHEMLKLKFLQGELVDPKTGELIGTFARSSATLSTVEFMDFIAQVQQWMAEQFGTIIPDPNESMIKWDKPKEKAS